MSIEPFSLEIPIEPPRELPRELVKGSLDLRLADCMDVMKGFDDGHFDLAIVDPPYGIGAGKYQYWDSTQGKPAASNTAPKKWDAAIPSGGYFAELRRVSKHQIIWGGNHFELPASRHWLAWDKCRTENESFGMFELAWASWDASPKMFRMYPSHVTQGKRIHPTQKPVKLYRWLLERYAKPGQRILDTHMGSGSIAIAAHYAGVHLTACEIDADYYAAAMARIAKETSQTDFLLRL